MSDAEGGPPASRRAWIAMAPLLIFLALAGLFGQRLISGADPEALPSALIGRAAPEGPLPPLEGIDPPGRRALGDEGSGTAPVPAEARVGLVNFFASWCLPCRAEHPAITALGARGDTLLTGIAYKDEPDASRRFLRELGNPFERVLVDRDGRAGIEWGVTGVPETFVVAPDGTVRYRHRGPVDEEALDRITREIERARADAR